MIQWVESLVRLMPIQVLAQVDGVFVMRYMETWLAILIGLALARWSIPGPAPKA